MRAILIPTALAAAILTTPVAFAAQYATGAIKALDLKAHTLTLNDGTIYRLPAKFKNPGLKVGEKIQVSWDMLKGQHVATTVTIVK